MQHLLLDRLVQFLQHHRTRNAWQRSARKRRGERYTVPHGKDVRRSTFGHFAAFVEQQGIGKARPVGVFEQGQVMRPRQGLGARKQRFRIAAMGLQRECNPTGITRQVGGKGNHVRRPARARPFEQTALAAHDVDTHLCLGTAVPSHQFDQLRPQCGATWRHFHVQQGRIARQALPVALERERDASVNAQRREDAPTGEHAHLSRTQDSLVTRDDRIVV